MGLVSAAAVCCRVKFNTQEVVGGQIHEHPIVHAANVALEQTGKTLTWMLMPPLLKPLVWPLVSRFPPRQLEQLNVARMQLYMAALTLARNAMTRLGLPWQDELQLTEAFGGFQRCCSPCMLLELMALRHKKMQASLFSMAACMCAARCVRIACMQS